MRFGYKAGIGGPLTKIKPARFRFPEGAGYFPAF
jgi:hypothetical protein